MKVTAKRNFHANGIPGHPGKVLSFEEMQTVQSILVEMQLEGLVDIELLPEPIPTSVPVIDEVVVTEEPKPKKKRTKKVTE